MQNLPKFQRKISENYLEDERINTAVRNMERDRLNRLMFNIVIHFTSATIALVLLIVLGFFFDGDNTKEGDVQSWIINL